MLDGENAAPATEFELSRDEQWVLHAAFLDYVKVATREDTELAQPTIELEILERLETGEFAFTVFEQDRIRYELTHHIDSEHAPDRDLDPARSVIEKIDRRCPAAIGR